jgi:cytoskeletal protein RodZ
VSGTYPSVALEAVGVRSYAELAALGTEEVIRRLDDRKPPLHPAEAFLAVMVLSALSELRETTKSLDAAKRGFERATIVLAALGVILTALGVIVAIVAL